MLGVQTQKAKRPKSQEHHQENQENHQESQESGTKAQKPHTQRNDKKKQGREGGEKPKSRDKPQKRAQNQTNSGHARVRERERAGVQGTPHAHKHGTQRRHFLSNSVGIINFRRHAIPGRGDFQLFMGRHLPSYTILNTVKLQKERYTMCTAEYASTRRTEKQR